MSFVKTVLLAGAVLVVAAPVVAPANAEIVRRKVVVHEGAFGHGCRTVRTVRRGPLGRRVDVRRVCR